MAGAGRFRKAIRGITEFLWTGDPKPATTRAGDSSSDIALFESGEELVQRVYDAITLRRSVLITGPRGSGKTYCALEAIKRAESGDKPIIRGHHFLQGNREIPRDYLSEDMLVIREEKDGGRPAPKLLDALVTRFPGLDDDQMKQERIGREDTFPAVSKLDRAGESKTWNRDHWVVLFLDEINRFGDGFLDSLLSLTEERIIVRGGTKLYVPIILVATANPPGYDITAKKLSPPLQARISRSYRVSQPSHPTLTYLILPEQIRRYESAYHQTGEGSSAVAITKEIRKLAAGAALCMWGEPNLDRKGIGFLTPATRELIRAAADKSRDLAADLKALGDLVTFGPDARSVGDWIGCAMGLARTRADPKVTADDLGRCVIEALGHKVRENFNEGADPVKVAEKETRIARIARCVLTNDEVGNVFLAPIEEAAHVLTGLDIESIIGITGSHKASELERAFAWWLLDQLAAPDRRGFVDALATGRSDAFKDDHDLLRADRLTVSELALLSQLERKGRGLPGVVDKVSAFRAALPERLDPAKHLPAAVKAFPRLAPWQPALQQAIASDSSLARCAVFSTWVIALEGVVTALDESGDPVTSSLSNVSPAAGDLLLRFRRGRDAPYKDGPSEPTAGAITSRLAMLLPDEPPDVSAILRTTAEKLRREVAFGHETYIDRGVNAVATHLSRRPPAAPQGE